MRTAKVGFLSRIVLGAIVALVASCGGGGSGPSAPSALSYPGPQTYITGAAITPLNPSVQGPVTSYSVSPTLPRGITLNSTSGQISGTPTTPAAKATYTITAQGSGGSTAFGLSIAVLPAAPTGLSYPSPQTYVARTPITALAPTVTGLVTKYSASPALPAGLSLDPAGGQITGTPTSASVLSDYTITASNVSGSTSFTLSLEVIAVNVTPGVISRLLASGTPVTITLTIVPVDFVFSGTLVATASDTNGVFAPAVTVVPSNGGYTLALTVSTRIVPGHYTSNVNLKLCSDPGCTAPQAVPSVAVPFDIYVLSASSAWPGNHLTALNSWTGVPDWTMYQANAAHTGYVPVQLDPNLFSTRWQGPPVEQGDPYYPYPNTLTTSNGQLFIASGNLLYAYKEFDASAVWQYDFSGLPFPSSNPPSVASGVVYVAAGQQSSTYLFAFNTVDGSLVFKSPMSSQWEHYLAPAIGAQGIYTNAGTYGGIYGFQPAGQQLFFTPLTQTSQWTPAVDANKVYAYTGDALKVLDPATGLVQSSIVDPAYMNYVYVIGGSAVLGAPGSLFAANYANSVIDGGAVGNSLLHFNVAQNSIDWRIAGNFPSTPAYDAGVLYVANDNPLQLEARAEVDGSLLWAWVPPQSGDVGFKSEVLLTKSMIFVSTNLAIYGIDTMTHRTVWSYPLVGRLALSQNGILYIEGSGLLTAINVK